jgi:YD repeat-containing protein
MIEHDSQGRKPRAADHTTNPIDRGQDADSQQKPKVEAYGKGFTVRYDGPMAASLSRSTMIFNAAGELKESIDEHGIRTIYDKASRYVEARKTLGNISRLAYDQSNRRTGDTLRNTLGGQGTLSGTPCMTDGCG